MRYLPPCRSHQELRFLNRNPFSLFSIIGNNRPVYKGLHPIENFFDFFWKTCWQMKQNPVRYNMSLMNSSRHNWCDSGVVGNARPCQGRDRGFEPRLSLSSKGILKNQNSFFDLNHQNPYIAQISPAPALPLKNKIKSPILNYVSF